jgi:hypothetical protein
MLVEGVVMFKRPFRRALHQGAAPNIPPALRKANQMMAGGHYEAAAGIFEQFAQAAKVRNGPRAPWFFFQAGLARLKARQLQPGMADARQGLALLTSHGQYQRVANMGMRFVNELKAGGNAAEADAYTAYVKSLLPEGYTARTEPVMERVKRVLPVSCPGCGAPLRSDEVEWADELTAECPYCGSVVRAE